MILPRIWNDTNVNYGVLEVNLKSWIERSNLGGGIDRSLEILPALGIVEPSDLDVNHRDASDAHQVSALCQPHHGFPCSFR